MATKGGRRPGDVQGDAIRDIEAFLYLQWWNVSGALYNKSTSLSNRAGTGNGSKEGTIGFAASRVVPTAPKNQVRSWGALACCYLGVPK